MFAGSPEWKLDPQGSLRVEDLQEGPLGEDGSLVSSDKMVAADVGVGDFETSKTGLGGFRRAADGSENISSRSAPSSQHTGSLTAVARFKGPSHNYRDELYQPLPSLRQPC